MTVRGELQIHSATSFLVQMFFFDLFCDYVSENFRRGDIFL
jgi:hypothetical protein